MIKLIHGQILPSLLATLTMSYISERSSSRDDLPVQGPSCMASSHFARINSRPQFVPSFPKDCGTSKVVRLLTTPTACCARDTVAISFSHKYDVVQNPTSPYPYVFQTTVILGDVLCRFPIRYTASRPRTIQKSTLDKGLPTPVRT